MFSDIFKWLLIIYGVLEIIFFFLGRDLLGSLESDEGFINMLVDFMVDKKVE